MARQLPPTLSSGSIVAGDFSDKLRYFAMIIGVAMLGVFLTLAPEWFFGPTWFYFHNRGNPIPPGGLGMGLALLFLSTTQAIALWRNKFRWFAALLNLSGSVFWVAGFILGWEGLLGHKGLIEAPLMMLLAMHKFVIAATVRVDYRELAKAEEASAA